MMKNIIALLFFAVAFTSLNFKEQNEKNTKPNRGMAADTLKTDPTTGLKIDKGVMTVTAHCTGCHSSKLITNFHSDRNGWLEKIRWMQKTQKLWQLGDDEAVILDYLSKNYPPLVKFERREPLKNINWYLLIK